MDIPVELARIVISELGDQQVIFLRECDGERSFPILIGIGEALAIDRRLKGIPTPRPLTHDLLMHTIYAMGGTLGKVVIHDLIEHTFLAKLYIQQHGQDIEVDARPSDAIALAVGLDTPIFVADHVFDNIIHAEPGTREERLDLLRNRLGVLDEQIEVLEDMLSDESFLAETPAAVLESHHRQLAEMQTEYDAIEHILKKLG